MNKEIERKFLLPKDFDTTSLPGMQSGVRILQYYLSTQKNEVRLRYKSGSSFSLTVKTPGELSRGEWETEVPQEVFVALQEDKIGSIIDKHRFTVGWGDHKLEIDVYDGALKGLVVLECEFQSEEAANAFVLPEWAAGIAREVTGFSTYKNRNLAMHPKEAIG